MQGSRYHISWVATNVHSLVIICLFFIIIYLSKLQVSSQRTSHKCSTTVKSTNLFAFNYLEGKLYQHHPIISKLNVDARLVPEGLLIEPNGLLIPENYDCTIFNGGNFWGTHAYFNQIPSRWLSCWNHYGSIKSNIPFRSPSLPVIDEEYFESVAVWDSGSQNEGIFVIAELGARWGTWASRAILQARKNDPNVKYEALLVEIEKSHCEGARRIGQINNINFTVQCSAADPHQFIYWSNKFKYIDLVEIDMQQAELPFFSDNRIQEVFNKKVKRTIIATHSQEIHEKLKAIFSHWVMQYEAPFSRDRECSILIRHRGPDWEIYKKNLTYILENGCYYETLYGKVANDDGQLIMDNPKIFKSKKLFAENPNEVQNGD